MTINELLTLLRPAKQDIRVYFSFCRCVPTVVASWRGIYDEPALGWEPAGYSGHVSEYPTVASLIKEFENAIGGRTYSGWKGGDYSYTGDEPLHIDNPGDYTQTEIQRVEIKEWEVIIHTERRED